MSPLGAVMGMAGSDVTNHRRQLREFLIAKRSAISPAAAGLSAGFGRRRTPGLRREEVAALAGVGLSWYTWLEQGRDISVSEQTLKRIASALRLNPTDTACLCMLAGVKSTIPELPAADVAVIQSAADGFRAGPAIAMSARWDVEAYNELADRIFDLAERPGPFGRNHIWRMFTDTGRRSLYVDWEPAAAGAVGYLRMISAAAISPDCDLLIGALCETSPDFRRMWNAQSTESLAPFPICLKHPDIGRVEFTSLRTYSPGADRRVFIMLIPANPQTVRAMECLNATSKPFRRGIRGVPSARRSRNPRR